VASCWTVIDTNIIIGNVEYLNRKEIPPGKFRSILVDNINMYLKDIHVTHGKKLWTLFTSFSAVLWSVPFKHSNKFEVS